MTGELAVFIMIAVSFFVLLAAKSLVKKQFCVICASVSLVWLLFLVLYRLGYFQDAVLLGLLMGQSILGIYYLAERKVAERLHLFRLPFLLSLTLLAYIVITPSVRIFPAGWLILALWVVFLSIYALRDVYGIRKFVKNIIKCCRDW